jgi:hypothetical protein
MRHIRRHDDRASAGRLHLAPCRLESIDAAREQADVRAPAGERADGGAADSGRCAGDDDDRSRHINVPSDRSPYRETA